MRKDIRDVVKEISPDVEIRQNKNFPSMVHVFYKGAEVCAAPNQIEEKLNNNYTNEDGLVHPPIPVVVGKLKIFINKFDNDPEFRGLFS